MRRLFLLMKEIDDEITREEKKKKKQAEKRRDKRRKKRSLRESENSSNNGAGSEPLENRVGENEASDHDDRNGSELKSEMHHVEDTIDDLDDEEVKGQSPLLYPLGILSSDNCACSFSRGVLAAKIGPGKLKV